MADNTTLHNLPYRIIIIFTCLSFLSMPIGTAPLTMCSLLALTFWLLSGHCYRLRTDWLGSNWLLPINALCLLPWVAITWSSAPIAQSIKFAERSHYWLFAFVAASALKSEITLRRVLVFFVSGTAVTAVIRLIYSIDKIPRSAYLDKAFNASYITYSLLIVIAVAILAFFYRHSTTFIKKFLIAILILTLIITITQLNGRSGYLAITLLAPWIFITMFGVHRFVSVLVALLLAFILLLTSQKVRERISLIPQEIRLYQSALNSPDKKQDATSTSVGTRLMLWNDAIQIFKKHPFTGAGTGSYQYESKLLNPLNGWPHPHNSFLFIASNYGILGIGLYGWLLFLSLKRAWQNKNTLAGHFMMACLLVILIGSLTDTAILSAATGILLGFIVGIPTPDETKCES